MISKFTKEHMAAILGLVASIIGALMSAGLVYFDNQRKQESLAYEKHIESLNGVVRALILCEIL